MKQVVLHNPIWWLQIRRLVYTHAGNGILALAQDGIHLLWRWSKNDSNLSGNVRIRFISFDYWLKNQYVSCFHSFFVLFECLIGLFRRYLHLWKNIDFVIYWEVSSLQATTKFSPRLWQPKKGLLMSNDLPENSMDVVIPCFSLSKNDSYVVSASGRMITLYNMLVFKVMLQHYCCL